MAYFDTKALTHLKIEDLRPQSAAGRRAEEGTLA